MDNLEWHAGFLVKVGQGGRHGNTVLPQALVHLHQLLQVLLPTIIHHAHMLHWQFGLYEWCPTFASKHAGELSFKPQVVA